MTACRNASFTRAAALAFAALSACGGSVSSDSIVAGSDVVVDVQPPAAQVAPGGTVNFQAIVTGTVDTTVNWSVDEGAAGGTVSAAGLYTAPLTQGTYHVSATSQANHSKKKSATYGAKVGENTCIR